MCNSYTSSNLMKPCITFGLIEYLTGGEHAVNRTQTRKPVTTWRSKERFERRRVGNQETAVQPFCLPSTSQGHYRERCCTTACH